MKREQVLDQILRLEPVLRGMGVAGAGLFGSVARGDDDAASDIDIAVRPAAGMRIDPLTLLSLYGVFSDAFGYETPIDVVVLPARNAELGAVIAREGVFAFS